MKIYFKNPDYQLDKLGEPKWIIVLEKVFTNPFSWLLIWLGIVIYGV